MNNLSLIKRAASLLIVLLAITASAYAQIPKPMDSTYVNDFAKVLTKKQILSLNEQLHKLEREKHLQVAIVLVKKLPATYEIEDYSLLIGRKWQVGEQGRGLVYVAAIKQRKQRLEVGRAMEATFNDVANTAMLNDIKPFFRNEDYAGGLQSLVTNISQLAQPPVIEKPKQLAVVKTPVVVKPKESNGMNIVFWLGGFALVILIIYFVTSGSGSTGVSSSRPSYEQDRNYRSSYGYGGRGYSDGGSSGGFAGSYMAAARAAQDDADRRREEERRREEDSRREEEMRMEEERREEQRREEEEKRRFREVSKNDRDASDYGRWGSTRSSSSSSSSSSSGSGYSGSGTTSDW